MSQGSDDHAYIHPKRQRSVSPNPRDSFRRSSLKRSDVHSSSTTAGPAQATWNRQFDQDEAFLVNEMFMWFFVNQLTFILNK